jgi:hypothetical protein
MIMSIFQQDQRCCSLVLVNHACLLYKGLHEFVNTT